MFQIKIILPINFFIVKCLHSSSRHYTFVEEGSLKELV